MRAMSAINAVEYALAASGGERACFAQALADMCTGCSGLESCVPVRDRHVPVLGVMQPSESRSKLFITWAWCNIWNI